MERKKETNYVSDSKSKCNSTKSENEGKGKKRKRRNRTFNNDNNYTKSQVGFDTPNIVTKDASKDNDPKWYTNLDPLAKDYANLPFNQVLGLNSDVFRNTNPNVGNSLRYGAGMMTIFFEPTIGMNEEGPTAPINLAAQQIYTLVRRNKSGTMRYDKTDMMMLIMAMDSAYMVYEDLLRAYRTISTYNGMNRYYPVRMIQALGFDSSVQYELSKFRGILDMFAYKLASVNIPDQFDIIKRHSWMCSNIYLDDDNIKAQSYVFVPSTYYTWVEGTGGNKTYLRRTTYHSPSSPTLFKLSDIENIIDNIMNPILGSEDVGLISGDMLTTFQEGGMIAIKPVEDYAAIVPVYSSEVLLQIRNIFCCIGFPTNTANASGNIEQVLTDTVAGPYLQQKFAISSATSDWGSRVAQKPLLNFINEDTSPENVMVATRLITLCSAFGSGSISNVQYYGTENVTMMRLWVMTADGIIPGNIDQDITIVMNNTISQVLASNIDKIGYLSQFNNHPTMYFFMRSQNSSSDPVITSTIGQMANLCNYIFLDDEEVRRLHDVATMSLFTVKDYNLNQLR